MTGHGLRSQVYRLRSECCISVPVCKVCLQKKKKDFIVCVEGSSANEVDHELKKTGSIDLDDEGNSLFSKCAQICDLAKHL